MKRPGIVPLLVLELLLLFVGHPHGGSGFTVVLQQSQSVNAEPHRPEVRPSISLWAEGSAFQPSGDGEPTDTVRVRIWRALASGEELSMRELGAAVGERRQGELRAHLKHVEKQAQTLRNKSIRWRERRGLDPDTCRARLVTRTKQKEIFLRLK